MESVKFSFKNLTWLVNLLWRNGKLYFDRGWYRFAKAGKFHRGDVVVFQKTEWPHKFITTMFESEVLSKCNVAGKWFYCSFHYYFNVVIVDFESVIDSCWTA